MKILLIGPQGSGKSTQAELLAQYLNVPKISTGDIFRKISQEDSEDATKVREILDQGKLVDDETTSAIVEHRLQQNDCKDGFILDGYPRNIHQQDIFNPEFDKVFYLKVPNDDVTKRLMERGRADDTPEGIKNRLDLYYDQTQPLLDYYQNLGILVEVDGIGDIQKIQDEIKKHI